MNPRQAGFTLVELLVAFLIFGMIAAAGVGLLGYSVRAQAAADERLGDLAAVRRLTAIMSADLAQAAPRLGRDADGAPLPAFIGGSGAPGEVGMAFVRRGWANPDDRPRSSLQRVEYRLADDRFERRAWPMPDGAASGPPATVIRGVSSLALRYRDRGNWRDRWDPLRPTTLPQAVEVTVAIEGLGTIRQLFLVGAAG